MNRTPGLYDPEHEVRPIDLITLVLALAPMVGLAWLAVSGLVAFIRYAL